jgi:hypothetical protein
MSRDTLVNEFNVQIRSTRRYVFIRLVSSRSLNERRVANYQIEHFAGVPFQKIGIDEPASLRHVGVEFYARDVRVGETFFAIVKKFACTGGRFQYVRRTYVYIFPQHISHAFGREENTVARLVILGKRFGNVRGVRRQHI